MTTLLNRAGKSQGDYLGDLAEESDNKSTFEEEPDDKETIVTESNKSPKFKTLTELVCYYSQHPVTVDTIELNICLQYPVMSKQQTSSDSDLQTKF